MICSPKLTSIIHGEWVMSRAFLINLQFRRLMINYDLPWNPTRLEQRLGRIHRIGQERDVHAFNFVASESEEGQPIIKDRILDY